MNKIYNLFFILLAVFAVSCSKDSDGTEPLRDYGEQYVKDLDSIDKFIDTHYMVVSADYDVTFEDLAPTDTGHQSIRNQTDYPLQFKMVNNDDQGVDYKIYYIKLREGVDKNPTAVDSVDVSYKGNLVSLSQFDAAQSPIWAQLDNTVQGWGEIIPMFKTGFYDQVEGPDPVTFTDYGAGVMFLPSGMGYYAQSRSGIPQYSSLIFSFKLFELRYRDHDHDGILDKDEVQNAGDNPKDYDSDGDGTANYLDVDDDGDHIMTKVELERPHGENDPIYYYKYDGAATDDPATPYDDTQGAPDCSGDFYTSTRLRKYLDPTCH